MMYNVCINTLSCPDYSTIPILHYSNYVMSLYTLWESAIFLAYHMLECLVYY